MEEKLCPDCKSLKPTTDFHKDKSKKDGLNLYCKPCMIARQKAYALRPGINTAKDGMKRCGGCKETKPVSEFHAATTTFDALDKQCKQCRATKHEAWRLKNLDKTAAYQKKWRTENLERSNGHKRKQIYGIEHGTYERMLAEQDGKCAICTTTEPGGRGAFHVDHCHNSGKVRGLLCHDCNTGLGKFKDRADLLARAIKYLAERGAES